MYTLNNNVTFNGCKYKILYNLDPHVILGPIHN